MNIHVSGVSRKVSEDDLRQAFEAFGQVSSVSIAKENTADEPGRFGFVEMPVKSEAESAITELNGSELKGQTIHIRESRAKADRRHSSNRRTDTDAWRWVNPDRRSGDDRRAGIDRRSFAL